MRWHCYEEPERLCGFWHCPLFAGRIDIKAYIAFYRIENAGYTLRIAAIPATFMSVVTTTYILQAGEGLRLPTSVSYPAGVVFAVVFLFLYLKSTFWSRSKSA